MNTNPTNENKVLCKLAECIVEKTKQFDKNRNDQLLRDQGCQIKMLWFQPLKSKK